MGQYIDITSHGGIVSVVIPIRHQLKEVDMAKGDKLGFGLLGCGMVSPVHGDSLKELEDAVLVAVCDRIEERAKAFGEKYHCPYYTDVNDLLARDDIDVVDVCIPPGFHCESVVECATAGKHVIVEKPMEIDLQRSDRMIEACEEAGVKLAVILQNRFKKGAQALRRALDRGTLGKLYLGDGYVKWFREHAYYKGTNWRGTWKIEGGGALINQSIHTIDLLQWMMGPVESVFAHVTTARHDIEVEDLAVAMLQFKNGAMGVIEGATALYPGVPARLEIHGERGSVVLESGAVKSWDIENPGPEDDPGDITEETGTGSRDPMAFPITCHKAQIQDMIDAIKEGREPLVNGREGRKALEVIRGIYQSSKSGEVVTFPVQEEP